MALLRVVVRALRAATTIHTCVYVRGRCRRIAVEDWRLPERYLVPVRICHALVQVSAAGRNDQISARTTKVTPLGPGPLPLARLERLHHPLKRRGFPTFLCLRHDLFRGPARVLAPHHLVAGVLVLVELRGVLLPEPIPDRVPFFP